jgi:hypothetical protein
VVPLCTTTKKTVEEDDEPIWTTTPSQNKIEEFPLSEKIKPRA